MRVFLFLLFLPSAAFSLTFQEAFPDHPGYVQQEAMDILEKMDFKRGTITLPGGEARLEVPEGYYYLDVADSRTVLVDIWGNPNGGSLGMIFPAEYTPIDWMAWGVVIAWNPVGYVSDDGARDIDYDALLAQMQQDTRTESAERVKNGFAAIELVGWASPPYYDQANRKLHWAQEISFDDQEEHTLNYNLRALGRKGVLELNFVAGMDQLEQISAAIPAVSDMVQFNEGSRYEDFIPSMDTVAAVGIGGLIAGKVAAKTGLLVVALLFLKKFGVILILPLIVGFKKLFGRRNS